MKIKESGLWSRFLIPIPFKNDESEEYFLQKSKDCLETFFDKYTKIPRDMKKYRNPFRGSTLKSLKGEAAAWSFREFQLKGINDCDVNFCVGTPQDN